MTLDRITLSFKDEGSDLEALFQKHSFRRNHKHFRFSCITSVLFIYSWLYFDFIYYKNNILRFLVIKLILSLFFALGFLASYRDKSNRSLQAKSFLYVLMVGFCFIYMIYHSRNDLTYPLVFSLVIILIFNYAVIRLRFILSTIAGFIILFSGLWVLSIIKENLLISVSVLAYILLVINFLGMIVSYTIEYYSRSEFFLLNLLQQEKEGHISKIERKLYQDEVTGLFNRKAIPHYLDKKILFNRQYKIPSFIAFLDLDQLKYVNDTFGHDAGDQYIRILGSTILTSLRGNDMGFRYGGDEFLIFLDNCENGKNILERILKKYSENTTKDREMVSGSFSYGIVDILQSKEKSPEDLITMADKLMMLNKKERKIKRGELHPGQTRNLESVEFLV